MYLEDLAVLLSWLVVGVVQVIFFMACFILYRRFKRNRFFLVKDAARSLFRKPVEDFSDGRISLEEAVSLLGGFTRKGEREALLELVGNSIRSRNAGAFSELLFVLGFVEEWTAEVFGRKVASKLIRLSISGEPAGETTEARSGLVRLLRSVRGFAIPRAIALQQLASLSPKYALPMLVTGLGDDVLEVRLAAVWGLGRLGKREAYALLANQLDESFNGEHEVPSQYVLNCLGRMDLADFDCLIPWFISGRPETRLSLIALTSRICRRRDRTAYISRNDFSSEVYDLFLTTLAEDPIPGIRAGAAGVLKYFRDSQAKETLAGLIRDEDPEVRAAALSCCNEATYLDLLPLIEEGLESPDPRIRGGALSSALELGQPGFRVLLEQLCRDSDREVSAQILEGLQMAGQMTTILREAVRDRSNSSPASQVLFRLAATGKTDFLTYSLVSYTEPAVKLKLLEVLAETSDPRIDETVRFVAETTTGAVQQQAQRMLAGRA